MSDSARLQTSVNYLIEAVSEFGKEVDAHWPRGRKDGQPDFIAGWVKHFNQVAFEVERDARPFTD